MAFSPDGRHLLVTTKANGSAIDVFAVPHDGRPSRGFVANPSSSPVPFGIVFDRQHRLVVAEAGTSSLSTYQLNRDGTATPIASITNGQAALCWVVSHRSFVFGANAGSGTVTSYRRDGRGGFAVVSQTPVGGGSIDMAVDALRVNGDGSLTPLGSVTGLGGLEGIALA